MLEVTGISASYGQIQALSDVSLTVPEGRIVSLLGANGAGKTTTLNCISRMVPLTGGTVTFKGERIDRLAADRIVGRGLCQVPEGREIFAQMSVRENLEIGAHVRNDHAEIRRDVEKICDYFPVLRQRFKQHAGTLSGGEQQMLLIGRALMARPSFLMLDEPSLGLSPILVDQIFEIIQQINKTGITILLVEQNAQIALEVSDYAYILENGEVSLHATPADLLQNEAVKRAYLGS
jgi:branched-chain amino acid transport system ATP-binding protein